MNAPYPAADNEYLDTRPRPNGAKHGSRKARKMEIEWFDAAATAAEIETADPLIDGLLDAGAMSVLYGDSNSGKTFIALDMAFHVATGALWNSRAVKRIKRGLVVYVAAEGGTRIRKRLAALKRHHGGEPMPLFALVRYPIDLRSSDANLKELIALIAAAENEIGERCVWVVIDTLSRALAGGDENSPVDMGRIVSAADAIRDATFAHFTFVHHTGKDAARGARGHSLLRAATDTEIEVMTGAVNVTKQRDMETDFTLGFQLCDISIGEDPIGTPIKSAIVEWNGGATKPSKAEPSQRVPASQRLLADIIAQAIDDAGEMFRPFQDGPPYAASMMIWSASATTRPSPNRLIRRRIRARLRPANDKPSVEPWRQSLGQRD